VIDWLKAQSMMLAVISVGVGLATILAGAGVLIRLPADFFVRPADEQQTDDRHPALRALWIVGKNIVGVLLAIGGLLMSLPLVPGPGVVLLVVGVSLTSFPGKRRFERAMLGNRFVLHPINALRKQFGRPPLAMADAKVAA
jgi:hypothetical protein